MSEPRDPAGADDAAADLAPRDEGRAGDTARDGALTDVGAADDAAADDAAADDADDRDSDADERAADVESVDDASLDDASVDVATADDATADDADLDDSADAARRVGVATITGESHIIDRSLVAPPRIPPPEAVQRTRSFARGLWRIAAADVSSGNRVQLLRDGPATFDAMHALIADARERIVFEGYIFRDDEVGERFRAALIEAARRGVHVRLLVDWIGRMGTPDRFFRPMSSAGVEVCLYSPPGFRRWMGILPRDHRKLIVTDGAEGVTGGIGIGKEWKHGVLRRKRSPWRDTAVRIAGPAAVDMAESFERMWTRAREGRPKRTRLIRKPSASHLDPFIDPPSLVGIIEGEPGRMRVARALQMQALGAERTIWIASAYFAPSLGLVEALAGAARDGVDVRVLVPSRFDHPWLRTIITPFYQRMLRNGVRIWEWRGEMMHAKTNVVDGRWVRVGSTDFNILGVAINFELDAVIEDADIGAQAEEMFLEDLARSREIKR